MKKTLVLLMMLALVVSVVSAGSVYLDTGVSFSNGSRRYETNKDLEYYMNLDWTLIEGTDLDFNGNPYHYIEIKEIPSFAFCAKTREKALENYKKQLRLSLMLMLEDGEHIVEPGEETEDDIDWESICP